MAALAKQLDFTFPADFEVGSYLDSSRWGSFSVLSKKIGSSRAYQESFKLPELPEVLRMVSCQSKERTKYDRYITQASFRGFNRRKTQLASIGTCFVDLDYYNIKGYWHLQPYDMIDHILKHCEKVGIPQPSAMIDSGRGMQIKWYHDQLPKKALARWDAVQRHLVNHFVHLGGDHNAKDASRVLRIVNTVNQKSGLPVELIYINNRFDVDEPVKYSFNELAAAVIPMKLPTDDQIIDLANPDKKTRKKASVSQLKAFQHGFSVNSLNWTRLCDLQKLIKIRGGDVGEGLREPMAFYLCNFYGLRYSRELGTRPLDDWNEFRGLCLEAAPHWDEGKIRNKTSNIYQLTRAMARGETVEFNGVEYPPLYTPKNTTLIDLFQITDDELRQMATILSPDEKRRRDALRKELKRREAGAKERKEYEDESKAKKEQAIKMKEQGLKNKEIAEAIGVHVKSVSRYLKR